MWRVAEARDDEAIVRMCTALYGDDFASRPGEHVARTLAAFRADPVRGRAVVLEVDGAVRGYAFLVSFWSNELDGEICTLDEIYIEAPWRSRGHAAELIAMMRNGSTVWPRRPVALELEVAPANVRARGLYERLGFHDKRNATMRLHIDATKIRLRPKAAAREHTEN